MRAFVMSLAVVPALVAGDVMSDVNVALWDAEINAGIDARIEQFSRRWLPGCTELERRPHPPLTSRGQC